MIKSRVSDARLPVSTVGHCFQDSFQQVLIPCTPGLFLQSVARQTDTLMAKSAPALLTSKELEKLLGVPPVPHFHSSISFIDCSRHQETQRVLTLPPSFTSVLDFLTSEWYGANAAQSPVQWLQLGARPEFRKASWHVSNVLQEKLHATRCHRTAL